MQTLFGALHFSYVEIYSLIVGSRLALSWSFSEVLAMSWLVVDNHQRRRFKFTVTHVQVTFHGNRLIEELAYSA